MTEQRVNLEELKAAEAAAGPPPWELEDFEYSLNGRGEDGPSYGLRVRCPLGHVYGVIGADRADDDNARFIVLMRNALPALIAEVEASRAENEATKAAIRDAVMGGEYRACKYGWCPFCAEYLDFSRAGLPFDPDAHAPDCIVITGQVYSPADATHEQVIGGAP